jgi:hypothetical protein
VTRHGKQLIGRALLREALHAPQHRVKLALEALKDRLVPGR